MKKILLLLFLIALIGGAYYFYNKSSPTGAKIIDYVNIVNSSNETQQIHSAVNESVSKPEVQQKPTLTSMLETGIRTQLGILRSKYDGSQYRLNLDNHFINVHAISRIELIKAFQIQNSQILLIAYNQGGNQCNTQYQILAINHNNYKLTPLFGNCLTIKSILQKNNILIIQMPQNNPYLGPDVLITYKYANNQISLIDKPTRQALQHKYSKLSSDQILQIASNDKCYVDGVLLYDNACDNGQKYCTMFKNLSNPIHDQAYKILYDFCK